MKIKARYNYNGEVIEKIEDFDIDKETFIDIDFNGCAMVQFTYDSNTKNFKITNYMDGYGGKNVVLDDVTIEVI